ncbi:MAG: CPBP family intramembrane metalloprotease [Prolixibacteraceae bacterium]|nr:CPBP family intramembrane metalloprotease [Prolixibacteraceae bacterium]
MAFTAFREMKPFSQLMFSAFVILASFLAFLVVSLLIAVPLFGLHSMLNIPTINDLGNPENIRVLKYFQVVQSLGLFIVPPFILGWLYSGKISDYLFLNKSFSSSTFLLVVVLIFFAAPFINFVGEINSNMHLPEWMSGIESWMKNAEGNAAKLTEAFLKVETTGGLIFNLFMIAFLPAIGEELLFRGVIQRIFTQMTHNHHWGIWITAILFSALHMQFYGFVPRMLLGVLFGYLLVWSGSIWLPILAHFLNNGIAVLAMFFIQKNMLDPKIEKIGSASSSYYMAVISLFLILSFMWMIKRQNSMNKPGGNIIR